MVSIFSSQPNILALGDARRAFHLFQDEALKNNEDTGVWHWNNYPIFLCCYKRKRARSYVQAILEFFDDGSPLGYVFRSSATTNPASPQEAGVPNDAKRDDPYLVAYNKYKQLLEFGLSYKDYLRAMKLFHKQWNAAWIARAENDSSLYWQTRYAIRERLILSKSWEFYRPGVFDFLYREYLALYWCLDSVEHRTRRCVINVSTTLLAGHISTPWIVSLSV